MKKLFLILAIIIPLSATALTAEKRLSDPEQEQLAHDIFKQIRCVVCSGESINDSNSDIATDMRILIRKKIESGETAQTIIDSLAESYGVSILMKPPVSTSTYPLWLGPPALLLFAIIIFIAFFTGQKPKSG